MWTDDLRSAVGGGAEGEGLFWISLDDFVEYFETLTMCRLRPNLDRYVVIEGGTVGSFEQCDALYNRSNSEFQDF